MSSCHVEMPDLGLDFVLRSMLDVRMDFLQSVRRRIDSGDVLRVLSKRTPEPVAIQMVGEAFAEVVIEDAIPERTVEEWGTWFSENAEVFYQLLSVVENEESWPEWKSGRQEHQ